MSTSGHASNPQESSISGSIGDRPATIAELAAIAQRNLWDPEKPLKHWLRAAEKSRKLGQELAAAGNYEPAFIELAKAATIVLEKLPKHREYQDLLNTDQRHNLGMNGQDILDALSGLKPILVQRYEDWRAQQPPQTLASSSSTTSDLLSREESARRKREEVARAQEAERARHALEAAKREEEWKREELARRQTEERERNAQHAVAWSRQASESRLREDPDAKRAAEAREAAEYERAAYIARLKGEEEVRRKRSQEVQRQQSDEDDKLRKRVEERRKHEQEGILRRQQEADAAARAARRELADFEPSRLVRSGTPSHITVPPPLSAQGSAFIDPYRHGPPMMPLESPRYDDDTDVEGKDDYAWRRRNGYDNTPTKPKSAAPPIQYPPPFTTTSPAPPESGSVQYPTLMSQHQLKQGYVPSLQSMFKPPAPEPFPARSSLGLETQPTGSLYSNILPKPSMPAPVVPPPPMPEPVSNSYTHQRNHSGPRGPSPRPPLPPPPVTIKDPVIPPPPPPPLPSTSNPVRIVRGAQADSEVHELKSVRLPRDCLPKFLSIARVNTQQNRETCGLLLGKDKGNKYVVTTLLIPKQRSTSDTCTMDEEELVLQFTEERHLITLGWIHTHPTQSCFMSSVDLHTHSGFQRMLPESFAVVCAPSSTPTFGIFRLTDPGGLQTILECTAKEAFHPHPEVPIYTDCDNSHVQIKDKALEIVDLR